MRYKIVVTKTFESEVKKYRKDKNLMKRISQKIKALMKGEEKGKFLVGPLKGYRSVRIGAFRMIIKVDEERREVFLIAFGHRKKIYEKKFLVEVIKKVENK